MEGIIERLQKECEYSDGTDGEETGVESLIAYKDALEDLVGSVDSLMICNSGTADAARERARHDWVQLSAADVCGALFTKGFGR